MFNLCFIFVQPIREKLNKNLTFKKYSLALLLKIATLTTRRSKGQLYPEETQKIKKLP